MHQHMITHMSRFFCLWCSTIVSFPFISYTTIHEISRILQRLLLYYQESSNRCSQDRTRTCNNVTIKDVIPFSHYTLPNYILAAPTGLEPVPHAVTGRYCSHSTMEPKFCSLYGNRTRDFAVKGRRLNPLSNRPF